MVMPPVPSLSQVWRHSHHIGALVRGKSAAATADEYDHRAIGFLNRDRMAQAIIVRHACRRHRVGVLAGAQHHGKTDQRSREAESALAVGG